MKISDIIEAIQTNRVRITDHADEEANSDQLTFDGLVKSRHSRAGGTRKPLKRLDSRFHGNDGKANLWTFYEFITFDEIYF